MPLPAGQNNSGCSRCKCEENGHCQVVVSAAGFGTTPDTIALDVDADEIRIRITRLASSSV